MAFMAVNLSDRDTPASGDLRARFRIESSSAVEAGPKTFEALVETDGGSPFEDAARLALVEPVGNRKLPCREVRERGLGAGPDPFDDRTEP